MPKRMLIDATHPEETRVVVADGNELLEYDYETSTKRQLKSNIYLAKVTRVEPSLQAAFVDFGGDRHGFLAFNEIHPDYYRIPIEDREKLLAESDAENDDEDGEENGDGDAETVEVVGDSSDEDIQELNDAHRRRLRKLTRSYKIQEVIKRRQILLVQVVKEERGTKGAALTTYLSLAGRYCVLMPNTDRGGGISRKIGSVADRKKLKKIVGDLGIPEGMAVIVRTAGAERSRAEIRRDYDYLLRLWNQIRELTLSSIAPALVHEEGDLIKRSIRDLYTKDIDEVVVHGEDGYRAAKDFMKILIPSHAKKVQKYKDVDVPLTHNYRIENQLDVIHEPEVHLKSGGYIVINPTEALVAIDVNSGRATKERNIEETALKTNLEAAEEIARQLKLRDLAGLIVIDFIDMEVNRNQTKVERAMKEAMRSDRARIQIGRISPFGLLELSRQRLRPSLIETSSEPCPYCRGSGVRRSTETTAVEVLREIEEEGMRKRGGEMTVFVPTDVALYLLNRKRDSLAELEERFEIKIYLENDDSLIPPDLRIERDGEVIGADKPSRPTSAAEADGVDDSGGRKRRRRRPRRKRRDDENATDADVAQEAANDDEVEVDDDGEEDEATTREAGDSDAGEQPKRRRRGRRGGRRRRRRDEESTDGAEAETIDADGESEPAALIAGPEATELLAPPSSDDAEVIALPDGSGEEADAEAEPETEEKPKRRRRPRKAKSEDAADGGEEAAEEKPKRRRRSAKKDDDAPAGAADSDEKPKRQRKSKAAEDDAEAETEVEAADEPAAEPVEEPAEEAQAAEAETEEVLAETAEEPVETPAVDPELASEAAKTTVIQVGGEEAAGGEQPRRSGWWDR